MSAPRLVQLQKLATNRRCRDAVASIDSSKSRLVAGFLEKCGQAGLSDLEILEACIDAVQRHPAIRAEFEKCAFVPAKNMPQSKMPPAPSAAPTTAPTSAPAARPKPARPGSGPQSRQMMTRQVAQQGRDLRSQVAPASEKWYQMPGNIMREMFGSGPVREHLVGSRQNNAQGDSEFVDYKANEPQHGAMDYVSGAGRSALAGLGALPAVAVDAMRGQAGGDYSRMMARDLMTFPNMVTGANFGHSVESRPDSYARPMGTDAGRGFFGDTQHQLQGRSQSANNTAAAHHHQMANQPNSMGGSPVSRAVHSGLGWTHTAAEPALTLATGGGLAAGAGKVLGASRLAAGGGLAANAARGGQLLGNGAMGVAASGAGGAAPLAAGAQAVDEVYGGVGYPQTADAMRKDRYMANAQNAPAGAPNTADPAAAAGGLPGTAGAVSDAVSNEVLNETGVMTQMADFVASMPQQATAMATDLGTKIKDMWSGNEEVAKALETGEMTPGMQETGTAELAKNGFSMEQIPEMWNNMDTPMKWLLGLGVTLGGIGLISALSDGGIESWLMAALGLGGAGAAAAGAGMFGEGAQNAISGLFGSQGSGEQAPQPATSDAGEQGWFDRMKDGAKNWAVETLPESVWSTFLSDDQRANMEKLRAMSPEAQNAFLGRT